MRDTAGKTALKLFLFDGVLWCEVMDNSCVAIAFTLAQT